MAQTKNYSGPVWKSDTLNQSFIILTDAESIEFGLRDGHYRDGTWIGNGTDKSRVFQGKKAVRLEDEKTALVSLSKKPSDYLYDFVLI